MSKIIDADLINLEEIERRAWAKINWSGGCALPPDTPPDIIVSLVEKVRQLRKQVKTLQDEVETLRRKQVEFHVNNPYVE